MKKISMLQLAAALTVGLQVRQAWANDDLPPEWLRDGVITVTLKNGTIYQYSTNDYKVVRRGTGRKTALSTHQTQNSNEPRSTCDHKQILQPKAFKPLKNRFRFLGGYGYDGSLKVSRDPDYAEIVPKRGALIGAGYDRLFGDRFSAGVLVIGNGSLLLGVGADFE